MNEELKRLYVLLEQAESDWREHRQSAWKVWQGQSDQPIGTATANPWTREYWERYDELKAKFEAALQHGEAESARRTDPPVRGAEAGDDAGPGPSAGEESRRSSAGRAEE